MTTRNREPKRKANDNLSCTTCGKEIPHLNDIHQHPKLKTALCQPCHRIYREVGDLSTYKDGVSLFKDNNYCRWCLDGGELIPCSQNDCFHCFCEECIKRNLSLSKLKRIRNDKNWLCFVCDTSQLDDLIEQVTIKHQKVFNDVLCVNKYNNGSKELTTKVLMIEPKQKKFNLRIFSTTKFNLAADPIKFNNFTGSTKSDIPNGDISNEDIPNEDIPNENKEPETLDDELYLSSDEEETEASPEISAVTSDDILPECPSVQHNEIILLDLKLMHNRIIDIAETLIETVSDFDPDDCNRDRRLLFPHLDGLSTFLSKLEQQRKRCKLLNEHFREIHIIGDV